MSTTNFSPEVLAQLNSALQEQAAAASTNGDTSFDGFQLPFDADGPNWSTLLTPGYGIPYNSDGSINVQALYDEVHGILMYLNTDDSMDTNAYTALTALMMNIANPTVQSQLAAQGAQGFINGLFSDTLTLNGQSETLAQALARPMAELMIYGYFYQNAATDTTNIGPDTQTQANNFIAALENLGAGNSDSILNPLLTQAQAISDGLPTWLTAHWVSVPGQAAQAPDMTMDDFCFQFAANLQSGFSLNPSMGGLFDQEAHADVEYSLQGITNPWEELMLLLGPIMTQMNDSNMQIGGQGTLNDYLSNMTNTDTSIQSEFSSMGSFTGSTAQAFYENVYNLQVLAQNQQVSGSVGGPINALYQSLFNSSTGAQATFTISTVINPNNTNPPPAPTTITVTMSLGQLNSDINGAQPVQVTGTTGTPPTTITVPYTFSWTDMANALNSIAPPSASSPPSTTLPPAEAPGYNTLSQDITGIAPALTAQSSATVTAAQTDTGLLQDLTSYLTAVLSSMTDPCKFITQEMQSAGS